MTTELRFLIGFSVGLWIADAIAWVFAVTKKV